MNTRTTGDETVMELGILDPVDLEQVRVCSSKLAAAIARVGGPLATEITFLLGDDLPALLTELAAARPVVSEARALEDDRLDELDTLERLSLAVAAYDRVVAR